MLADKEDRFSLRVTRYETKVFNATNSADSPTGISSATVTATSSDWRIAPTRTSTSLA
jgi:hypothetical protein